MTATIHNPTLWRLGYRARLMDVFYVASSVGRPLAGGYAGMGADFAAGHEAAEKRANELEQWRDLDPEGYRAAYPDWATADARCSVEAYGALATVEAECDDEAQMLREQYEDDAYDRLMDDIATGDADVRGM